MLRSGLGHDNQHLTGSVLSVLFSCFEMLTLSSQLIPPGFETIAYLEDAVDCVSSAAVPD